MNSYIKDVIDSEFKDNYVKQTLYLIVPHLINYFDEKYLNIILDAIRNTTIYVCPANQPFANFISNKINIGLDSYYNKVLNTELLNNKQGIIYEEHPRIVLDEDTKEFHNKGIERKIIFIKEQSNRLFKNNTSEELKCATIIRSLVSLIKSNRQNNTIRNDIKRTRFGLHQTIYKLTTKGNNVETTYLSETGFGLYNGILEYDTEEIFKEIFNHSLKEQYYSLEKYIVEKIFSNKPLENIFHEAEITGNIFLLRNCFDKIYYDGAFDKLIQLTDSISNSNYRKDKKDYDEAVIEIEEYFKSLTNSISNSNYRKDKKDYNGAVIEIGEHFNSLTDKELGLKHVA